MNSSLAGAEYIWEMRLVSLTLLSCLSKENIIRHDKDQLIDRNSTHGNVNIIISMATLPYEGWTKLHVYACMNAYICISVYIYIYAYTLNYQQSISFSTTNYRFSEEVNSIWIHSWSPNHEMSMYTHLCFLLHIVCLTSSTGMYAIGYCPCYSLLLSTNNHQLSPMFTMNFSLNVVYFSFDNGWVPHL